MRKLIFLYLALLFAFWQDSVFAQKGVVRLELPAEMNAEIYHLAPCSNNGLLLIYETRDFFDDTYKKWIFIQYDTLLNEVRKLEVPVVPNAQFQSSVSIGDAVFLLFANTSKIKGAAENFQISGYKMAEGQIAHIRGLIPSESQVVDFGIAGNNAVIGLNLKNNLAQLVFVGLQNGTIIDHSIDIPDQVYIEELRVDPDRSAVNVLVSNYVSKRQNSLYLLGYNMDGSFLYNYQVFASLQDKYLNTARVFPLENGDLMLIGTYNNFPSKIPGTNDYDGLEATGMFSTKFHEGQQEFINYYNFMEFQNLRNGLNSRDLYRMQRKHSRENSDQSLNFQLVLHHLELHNDKFTIMAEAYYPDYRTVSDISYDYWGRPITQTYTVFEGYRFTNTVLVGFSKNGEMIWDDGMEMSISNYFLDSLANYYFDGLPVILYTNQGNRIAYQVFINEAEMEGMLFTDLESLHSGDKVMDSQGGRIVLWYGHQFLCSGYQTIRNNLIANENKRTVFYLNRLSFE